MNKRPHRVHRQDIDHAHPGLAAVRPTESLLKNGRLPRESIRALNTQRRAAPPGPARPPGRPQSHRHSRCRTPYGPKTVAASISAIRALHARYAVGQELQAVSAQQRHPGRTGWPAGRCSARPVLRVSGADHDAGQECPACPFEAPGAAIATARLHPGTPQAALADQQVDQHAEDRQQHHQQQPRRRTALGVALRKQPKGNRQQNGHVKKGQQAEVHCRSVVSGRRRRHHARTTVSARA
jgi:hypothetical protein